jgi:tRNA U34 5-carboxymethylaminomethyl modifying GTPase MnmE/TrmE
VTATFDPSSPRPRYSIVTPPGPGAIGIIQVTGPGARGVLQDWLKRELTDRCALVRFEDIDEGLAVALGDQWCQLMSHGGVRVIQRLAGRLGGLGIEPTAEVDALSLYPEARTHLEADVLLTISQAASPAAIDHLLSQSDAWQRWLDDGPHDEHDRRDVERRSAALDHLLRPPTVAVLGRANVGKSTLANLLAGRTASIAADLPGTTRDWVGAALALPTAIGSLAVIWIDTPGLRTSADPIEQQAIELARGAVQRADVLVAMRDPQTDWPDLAALPRRPDVWLMNKADLPKGAEHTGDGTRANAPLPISALAPATVGLVSRVVASVLGLDDPHLEGPWCFSASLRAAMREDDPAGLYRYVTTRPAVALPGR